LEPNGPKEVVDVVFGQMARPEREKLSHEITKMVWWSIYDVLKPLMTHLNQMISFSLILTGNLFIPLRGLLPV
jgi:hypothetical protein